MSMFFSGKRGHNEKPGKRFCGLHPRVGNFLRLLSLHRQAHLRASFRNRATEKLVTAAIVNSLALEGQATICDRRKPARFQICKRKHRWPPTAKNASESSSFNWAA